MTDDIDRAQERDAYDRDRAVAAALARIAASRLPHDATVDGQCIDCEQPIEPARLAALAHKTSRCLHCATAYEQRSKDLYR